MVVTLVKGKEEIKLGNPDHIVGYEHSGWVRKEEPAEKVKAEKK